MEDLRDLHKIAAHNDYMFSIDLKDGYFHIPIKPDHWKYFGLRFEEKVYLCTALPFGFAPAPVIFTKVVRVIVKHMRD